MIRGDNPTINVGIAADVDGFFNKLRKEFKDFTQKGADLGLADSFQKEIDEISRMFDGLQKTMKTVSATKLNSTTFSKFQKNIGGQIEALEKRTTALESGMETLVKTMSKADGGKFKSMMDEIKQSMSETLNTAEQLTDAIGTVVKSGSKNANINIVTKQQVDDLKEIKQTLKDINSIQGSKSSKTVDSMRKDIEKLSQSYVDLKKQMNSVPQNSKEFDDLQRELAETMLALKTYEANIYETFSDADMDKILNKSIKNLGKAPQAILDEIDKTSSRMISNLQSRIEEMNKYVGEAVERVEDKDKNLKGFSVPVSIKTSPSTLEKQVKALIDEVRPLVADKNIEIGISLVTDWGNRKQKELFKEFQSKIGSIVETSDSAEIKAIYDDITKYFNDEIRIKIRSDIDKERERIIKNIDEIRKKIQEEPLNLDVSSDNKNKQIYDKSILKGLDNLADKLKEVQKISSLTRSDLSKINTILSELRFPGATKNIEELDKAFDSLQKKLSSVANRRTDKNRQTVQNVLKGFKEYQAAGGQRGFEELTNNKNIKNWFKEHINDPIELDGSKYQQAGKQLGEEYAAGIRQSIAEVVKACQEMVQAANDAVAYTQDSHSPSRVAEELGNYWGEGYANGILNSSTKIKNAIRALVEEGKLTLQDLSEDTVHPNESDQAWIDIANQKKPTKTVKGLQEVVKELDLYKAKVKEAGLGKLPQDSVLKENVLSIQKKNLADIRSGAIDATQAVENLRKAFAETQEVEEKVRQKRQIASNKTSDLSVAQDEVQKFLSSVELLKSSKVYQGIENAEEKIAEFAESVHDGMYSAEEAFHAFTESSSFDPDARVADLEKEKQQAEETAQAEEELANSRKKADSAQDKMSDEQLDMYAQWAEDADKIDNSLEETLPTVDKISEEFQETTSTVDKLLERLEQLPSTVQAGLNAIDSNHWKGLDKIAQIGTHDDFRRGKDKYSEKQISDATNLLKLAGDFQQTGNTDYLKELYKSVNTSEISSRMKNALKGRIWQIVKDIEKGAGQAVEETVKEETPKKSTKIIEMTKGKYKEYVRQSGLIADNESFDHNFDLHLKGLERKGLAEQTLTKSGKKGKWKIQVEVEVDDHALELTEKELQELNQQEREFVDSLHSQMSDADIKNDFKRAEAIEKLASGFEKLKTLIGKEGNFDLRQDSAKDKLSTYIEQYIKYRSQGGSSKLNDLTDNPKVLQKLKKEYERQIDLRKQKSKVTKEEISEETKNAKASEQNAKAKSKSATADENLVNAQKKKTQQVKETTKEIQNQVKAEQDLKKAKSNQSKKGFSTESTNDIKKQSEALNGVQNSAKNAAKSKEDFSEANKEVLQSIVSSLNGLNNEGKAFENLNKLINNLGGKNGDTKLKSTLNGLKEIVKVLSYPLDGNSFIDALEKIASSGSNLGDIATILKASNKNLLETVDTLNKVSGIDIDDILNSKPQEILDNAKLKLLELGGKDSQIINISNINKTKDGFLEIVGVLKTANDQLQEFTLHTKDGIEMQNVGMSENTARLAKQMKMYAQVEQFFNRMKEQGKMLADDAFFDPNEDPETWKMILEYAEEYRNYLGEIRSITMQTRQDKAGGMLLESFSINGANGNHLTLGPTGNIVASTQDILNTEQTIKKIQELIQERKKYNDLIQKRVTGTATEQELDDLTKLDNKLAEVTGSVQHLNDLLGDNEAAKYFEIFQSDLTSEFNNTISKFTESSSKKISNALTSKNNQYTSFVADFQNEINTAIKNIDLLNEAIKNHPANTPWSDDERSEIKEMVTQIDRVTAGIKDLENVYESIGSVDKLISKISKDLNDNTAMSGNLKTRFSELRDQIKALRGDSNGTEDSISQIDKITFKRLTAEFNRLHAEMLDTKQTGDSFFTSLAKAARSRTVQFLARYLSFYDFIRYGRQAYETIKQLDTALVDLKKTTTMSNSELQEFYINSSNIAKQMGTSTEQIISQAAAWSRLGYSSKESATEMAALSSQFAAISPGMSLDDATDNLVSTMKAFHIAVNNVESDIMDPINRLGNTMATSNSEIGEMLKRSSAAMAAANNSLAETAALESAAVQITRNAETTGMYSAA